MLKNHMEDVIDIVVLSVVERYTGHCNCERCIEDIKAIALNNLKPMYTSTANGKLYAQMYELDLQFKTNVIRELSKAIERVAKNPRCDKNFPNL